ncbi:MAG: gas vesicle protein GvpG [Ignavibacteriaceae bacterium]|nr:gas vesicle protein GvpG [Ignavibacteriaceae bacterium]
MFLIDDILLAPLKGVMWLAEQIKEVTDREFLDDEDKIKEKLMALQLKYELDEISEEEYDEEEKKLLMRLDIILKQEKEKRNG